MKVDASTPLPVSAISSVSSTDNLGSARQDVFVKLNQIAVGSSLQAKIVGQLNNGNFLVQIQFGAQPSDVGSNIQIHLPPGFKINDPLLLTLLSKEGDQVKFSASLMTPQETVQLSQTGQLLDKFIHTNQQPKVNGTTPLLPYPEFINTTKLSEQLNKSVNISGIFYEAHLRQWHDGDRNLEQIRQEPQNQPDTDIPNATNFIPTQLDTLENKRFIWHGELWPGQPIDWIISKDDQPSSSSSTAEQVPSWQTVLKLQLPLLGQVNATINLQGNHVKVNVNVQDPSIASLLKADSDKLTNALAASGTTLDILTVENDAGT